MPIDWREHDPAGTSFYPIPIDEGLAASADSVRVRLGLSFSVQDWVQAPDGWYFLEVNTQGQWLFLQGADNIVAPVLARHLLQASVTP